MNDSRTEISDAKATVSDEELDNMRQAIELLFFAYRDFTAEPDAILAGYGFGRAHHRVIYFVGRNPGITVSQLLEILQITKQSLARVLRQLVDEGFIEQRLDEEDGRRRLLHLLDKGHEIEILLTIKQARRINAAFAHVGAEAQKGFKDVLRGIINEKDRGRVSADD
ncbi:MAG: MarR family transcriptional regulator [Rhodospirillales bacterium]|nr:MarR family transcriptional regulator [Rhodospirillales bacterium]